jgi:predicted P-loop ATPase
MASLSKTDVNALKSFLSADKIKIRLPYGKKDVIMYRVANFIGSTNMSTFLQDETGSVRWLCFIVEKIDFSYKPNFKMDNLWSQAVYLAKDKTFDERISFTDVEMNEKRNDKFQIQTAEKDLLLKYFEVPKDNDFEILSLTDILIYLKGFAPTVNISTMLLGKALTSLKYNKIRSAQSTKYAVKKIYQQ